MGINPKDVVDSAVLLDVRTQFERDICNIKGSLFIPLDQLEQRWRELPKDTQIVVYCHHGSRSAMAVAFLNKNGLDAVNLEGGIDAWSREVDSSVALY